MKYLSNNEAQAFKCKLHFLYLKYKYMGLPSRHVVFRYDVLLLKVQTEVWISMKYVDLT